MNNERKAHMAEESFKVIIINLNIRYFINVYIQIYGSKSHFKTFTYLKSTY